VTGVWFYYEDDLTRFVNMYREIVASRTYDNVTRHGMSVQLMMRPLGLPLTDYYQVKLHRFGDAMQAHMRDMGVIVRGVEMLATHERMTNYTVRLYILTKRTKSSS